MKKLSKILLTTVTTAQLVIVQVQATTSYQLDNNTISTALNASETTEPRDNLFGNVFTAAAGGNLISSVDFGLFTTTPGTQAKVVLYLVTGAGGNPALGATRMYTQGFTPLTGDGTNAFLQTINLTTPVAFNVGDRFLVSVFMPNVIGAPPNDVYPYLLDTSSVATDTYWDRSNPNTFNLDNLTGAMPIDQPFVAGGFTPGPGHVFIRAFGTTVPEPSAMALLGSCGTLWVIFRRKGNKSQPAASPLN